MRSNSRGELLSNRHCELPKGAKQSLLNGFHQLVRICHGHDKLILTKVLFSFIVSFLVCSPAHADLFKLEERSETSNRKLILILEEDFPKEKCQLREAKALVYGDFDPSYFYRFKTNKVCVESFVSKYGLTAKNKDVKSNFILLNNIHRNWWKPEELEESVYYESQKKSSDNNMYYLMYDAVSETAYLYLQNF